MNRSQRFFKKAAVALIPYLTASLMFAPLVHAQSKSPLLRDKDLGLGGTAEYVFRNDAEELLIPVYMLGAVNRPGLYHVPPKTDLLTLVALSGGTTRDAELDRITIKRQIAGQVSEIDLEHLVANKDAKAPLLGGNDVIMVRTKEPAISNDTLMKLGVITSVLTIVVSGFLLSKTLSSNK